jgi:hypothetical protein
MTIMLGVVEAFSWDMIIIAAIILCIEIKAYIATLLVPLTVKRRNDDDMDIIVNWFVRVIGSV